MNTLVDSAKRAKHNLHSKNRRKKGKYCIMRNRRNHNTPKTSTIKKWLSLSYIPNMQKAFFGYNKEGYRRPAKYTSFASPGKCKKEEGKLQKSKERAEGLTPLGDPGHCLHPLRPLHPPLHTGLPPLPSPVAPKGVPWQWIGRSFTRTISATREARAKRSAH